MQDKMINSALLSLLKQGEHQGSLAEVLLNMREVPLPVVYQVRANKRGEVARLCMAALKDGPKTTRQVADMLLAQKPQLELSSASHRIYVSMRRLVDKGKVGRDGRLWTLGEHAENGSKYHSE